MTSQDADLDRQTGRPAAGPRAAEAERDQMRLIFDVAPVGMLRAELDGRITLVNPTLLHMLGYREDEALAVDPMAVVHPDDRAAVAAQVAALRNEAGPPAAPGALATLGARRLVHKNGTVLVTNVSASVARDAGDRALFVIAVIEDISEKTRLEVELRHAQKLESVGRLAAGIAHEINTPIQFIGDNTTFLRSAFAALMQLCDTYAGVLSRVEGVLPPAVVASLRDAEETADLAFLREHVGSAFAATFEGVTRVAKTVRAMKTFAHADQGRKTFADLNAALRDTLTVGANELKYVAEVESQFGELPPVECCVGDLNQVFLNLLVNAAHAVGDVMDATGAMGRIRVRTWREAATVVVAIADTGTGIPEGIRHRVFDPFFTTKEVGRGTGQGLAISRSVVEKHGGTLTFETTTGQGTTFFVRLPVAAALPGEDADTVRAPGRPVRRALG